MRSLYRLLLAVSISAAASPAAAQVLAPPSPPPILIADPPQLALPPATRLEAFMPTIGSIMTVGYQAVGRDTSGVDALNQVLIETRELRDTSGQVVRGLVVDVTESATVRARAFVDADEVADAIKGLDALLQVIANPTPFDHFEMRYTTKGDLVLMTFSNTKGVLRYAVEAGRVAPVRAQLDAKQMGILRGLLTLGLDKLNAAAGIR